MTGENFSQDDPTLPHGFNPDDGWDILAEVLDRFCEAWDESPPCPIIKDFAGPLLAISDADFRNLALIETIKVDLEYRAGDDFPWKPLESYLSDWPQLLSSDGRPPDELVLEEFQHLKKKDSSAKLEQYQQRFQCDLRTLLRMSDSETGPRTTSLFRTRQVQEFQPGQTIDDFDLLSKLGKGAFASVFLARQNSMQRLVALKISANMGVEGQTLAQLDHPHIVRVYDQRPLPELDLRLMYMQYIAGTSLSDLIKTARQSNTELNSASFLQLIDESLVRAGQSAPIESANRQWIEKASWSQMVSRIGAQLASAFDYAHAREVLHRDLKPANVLVDEHGYPKLVDFNVSFSSNVSGATAATFFGGSLAYMSPEQLRAMDVQDSMEADQLCGKSDLYSLGILLYELLIGQRPFDESQLDFADLISGSTTQRMQGLTVEMKKPLEQHGYLLGQAIRRSLAPQPDDRLAAEAIQRQLEWASDSGIESYLCPPKSRWIAWAARAPFFFNSAIGLSIALFATWFISTYNVSASLPESVLPVFERFRNTVNAIVFPGCFLFMLTLYGPMNRVLLNWQQKHSVDQLELSLKRSLNLGHFTALIFAGAWTVAGVIYPVGLKLMGSELPSMTWYDFIGSHFLAGLITAAYVYCTTTHISMIAWYPRLVLASLQNNHTPKTNSHTGLLLKRCWFYQVLAIATPMLAVAILVNWRQTTDSFSLGVLSLSALAGMALVGWNSRRIHEAIEIMEKMEQ